MFNARRRRSSEWQLLEISQKRTGMPIRLRATTPNFLGIHAWGLEDRLRNKGGGSWLTTSNSQILHRLVWVVLP